MIRVVLDTNIIVSALLQPLVPPAQLLMLALAGSFQRCVSGGVYAEYEEVIRRPRFQRSEDVIAGTLHAIREKGFGYVVMPRWLQNRIPSPPAIPKLRRADQVVS